jgi:hypothetical protein
MGVDFGDLNGTGRYDIFVSNIASTYALEESNFLFLNTGEAQLMKQGVAPYEDHSEDLGLSRGGWTWDAKLADFNNSGSLQAIQAAGFVRGVTNRWPELHELAMGNDDLLRKPDCWLRLQEGDDLCGNQHNPFFVRSKDGRFYDISREIGIGDNHISRGIAIADVDGDGLLDFAVANQWETSLYYHNESPNPGAYLSLNLNLPVQGRRDARRPMASGKMYQVYIGHPTPDRPGRAAIGAAVTVTLPDGSHRMGQVDGGNGHSGRRSQELHFGLGHISAGTKLPVDIHFRDVEGKVHLESFTLTPGSFTIMLGPQLSTIITPPRSGGLGGQTKTPPRIGGLGGQTKIQSKDLGQ